MCFSAIASFTTAALTGTIGIIALSRTTRGREIPFAATPLVFAFQQCIEGALWLALPENTGRAIDNGLVSLFLFFAQVFWPIFAPLAVLLIEPQRTRRALMRVCLVLGIVVGGALLRGIVSKTHSAAIVDGHIVYLTEYQLPLLLNICYLAAIALPLVFSSHKVATALGTIVILGCVVTYLAYWEWFASVWCFFAATASCVILFHFATAQLRSPVAKA